MKGILTTIVCLAAMFIKFGNSDVLIADHSMSRMIELTTKAPFCIVHTDRGTIRSMLLSSDQRRVRQMSDDAISKLFKVCESNLVDSAYQGGFIYPGTKWCGPGTNAKNYSDLGYHVKEDICCRDHDNCPKNLKRGECNQGICNHSPFTRSHCDCDAAFRRCLQNVNSETANTIGAIFFNLVQVICFKERNPCSQWQNATSNELSPFNENQSECQLEYAKSGRYTASRVPFSLRNLKPFAVNFLLRKLNLLNGYSKDEIDKLCSQWNFRPSEKYVPLMPLASTK